MDPVGAHQFWGFSPALDLQQISRTVFGSAWPPPNITSSSTTSSTSLTDSTLPSSSSTTTSTTTSASTATTTTTTVDNTLQILLLMPGDPRHIIKTIAQRYRNSTRPIHVSPINS